MVDRMEFLRYGVSRKEFCTIRVECICCDGRRGALLMRWIVTWRTNLWVLANTCSTVGAGPARHSTWIEKGT